jgi:hypothetical protein
MMLQSELNMLTTANIIQEFPSDSKSGQPGRIARLPFTAPIWRVAAALILLGSGIGIGTALKSRPAPETSTNETLVALRQEVKEMKEEVMLNMIDDESASQRMKAVSYAEQMASPDQQVIDVLINTLNQDKNVNVRLAALYSLQRFSDRRAVRDSLVSSLRIQKEPIIQVVLINLLAEKRDTGQSSPSRIS